MTDSPADQQQEPGLATLARMQLENVIRGGRGLDSGKLAGSRPDLAEHRATFVTLNSANGQLRGCIGSLEARRPLIEDLLGNAVAAALRDPRFQPVSAMELEGLRVEVSVLTPPEPFPYDSPEDLLVRLQPGVHGVILTKERHRSTFLPQVWDQLPDPVTFLSHLCQKAGLGGECWKQGPEIQVYRAEKHYEKR
ncbi:MAG: AmmeMemoRadiSam system protein A [Magnetococcales bacterium]|nr:AmmeMemoRadiSam system protein A [Magnetococcales bacterium]